MYHMRKAAKTSQLSNARVAGVPYHRHVSRAFIFPGVTRGAEEATADAAAAETAAAAAVTVTALKASSSPSRACIRSTSSALLGVACGSCWPFLEAPPTKTLRSLPLSSATTGSSTWGVSKGVCCCILARPSLSVSLSAGLPSSAAAKEVLASGLKSEGIPEGVFPSPSAAGGGDGGDGEGDNGGLQVSFSPSFSLSLSLELTYTYGVEDGARGAALRSCWGI